MRLSYGAWLLDACSDSDKSFERENQTRQRVSTQQCLNIWLKPNTVLKPLHLSIMYCVELQVAKRRIRVRNTVASVERTRDHTFENDLFEQYCHESCE